MPVLVGQVGVLHLKVVDDVLQLTALVLGAEHAAVNDISVAQANVLRAAVVYPRASQTTVGMLRQNQVHDIVPDPVYRLPLRRHNHPVHCARGA